MCGGIRVDMKSVISHSALLLSAFSAAASARIQQYYYKRKEKKIKQGGKGVFF